MTARAREGEPAVVSSGYHIGVDSAPLLIFVVGAMREPKIDG